METCKDLTFLINKMTSGDEGIKEVIRKCIKFRKIQLLHASVSAIFKQVKNASNHGEYSILVFVTCIMNLVQKNE